MVRAFTHEPLSHGQLQAVLDPARRTPSAGHSQGVSLLVLCGDETGAYWDTTLTPERRDRFPWPGLLLAPALVVVGADPAAYTARYREADKAGTGLGAGPEVWPQPMWFIDGGMAVLALLYAAVDAGLGACFFGVFDHEAALKERFGVPEPVRLVGTVAIGHPDPAADRASRSSRRPRRADVVRFGRWQ